MPGLPTLTHTILLAGVVSVVVQGLPQPRVGGQVTASSPRSNVVAVSDVGGGGGGVAMAPFGRVVGYGRDRVILPREADPLEVFDDGSSTPQTSTTPTDKGTTTDVKAINNYSLMSTNNNNGGGGGGSSSGEMCDQWAKIDSASFRTFNDLWGMGSASAGSKGCITKTGESDGSVSFKSTWTFLGNPTSVKAYPNSVFKGDDKIGGVLIKDLPAIQSTFDWKYDGSNLDADVAYDLFMGSAAGYEMESSSGFTYEIMIWLAALGGAAPIGADKPAVSVAVPGCDTWNLYSGSNGVQTVYSFVSPSKNMPSFDCDLTGFVKALITKGLVDGSKLYLKHIAAGTEPFTGSNAVFTATMTVKVGGSAGGRSSTPTGPGTPTSTLPAAAATPATYQPITTLPSGPKPTNPPVYNDYPPKKLPKCKPGQKPKHHGRRRK